MAVKRNSGQSRKEKAGIKESITERQKAEVALRESEEKYKFLVDNSEDFIFVISKTGRILFANKKALSTIGYTQKEVVGKSIMNFLAKGSVKKAFYALAQEFLGRPQGEFNVEVRTKSGEIRILELSQGSAFVHEKGKLVGILINASDVTERRRTSEKYATIINTTPDGFWYVDTQGNFLDVNAAACKMLRYSKDELLKMQIPDVEVQENPKEVLQHIRKMLKYGHDRFETQHKRKDGRIIDVEVSTSVIKEAEGVERIFVFIRDITERKEAEAAMLQEKQFSDTVVDSIPGIFYIIDEKGRFVRLNKNISKVTGYSSEELLRFKATDIIAEEDRGLVANKIRAVFKKGYESVEAHLLTKDMRKIPYYFTGSSVVIGDKTYLIGMGIDITERKKAEIAALSSNAFNSAIVGNAPFGVMIILPDGSVDYVNPALLMISGDSRANFKQMNVFKLPTYIQMGLAEKIKACFRGKTFFMGSVDYVSHFSHKRTTRNFTGMPMHNELGKIDKVMLFIEDLTKIKETEELIKESEEQSRLRADETSILNKIIIVGNQAENLQNLMKNMLDEILRLLSFSGGGIYLRTSGETMVKLAYFEGLDAEFVKAVRKIDIRKKPFSIIFMKKETIFADDYASYHPALAKKFGIASLVSVPLFSKDEVIGALNVMSKKKHIFSESEKRILTAIGHAIGTSIVNQLEEESLTSRTAELEKFNKMTTGRELMMVELKKRIAELENEVKAKETKQKKTQLKENKPEG